jgi:hypothetical protein
MVIFHDQSGKNHICCSVASFLSWSISSGRQHACSLLCPPHITLTTVGKPNPESVEKSVEQKFGLMGRKIKRLCLARWMFVEFSVQQDSYRNFLNVSGVIIVFSTHLDKNICNYRDQIGFETDSCPKPTLGWSWWQTHDLWPWYNGSFYPIEILKIISNGAYALGFSCDLVPLNMSGLNEESSHDVDIQ